MTQRQSQVKLLTIHQMAQLCRTSPRTIRFYDHKGLLKPVWVDPYNEYRYYNSLQMRDFFKVRLMQNFNISLKNIKIKFSRLTKENFLKEQLQKAKEELDRKQKEYRFLNNIKYFLFTSKNAEKLLKKETIGPYVLLCRIIDKGRYDQINSYVVEQTGLAKKLKIKLESKQMIFYLDLLPYKPKDTTLEICLITKYKSIPKNINLPSDYYFKFYPKTRVKVFNYQGPFEYITLIYQKFYEKRQNRILKPEEIGFDIHIFGPWNKKSPYDHLTKICFPAN